VLLRVLLDVGRVERSWPVLTQVVMLHCSVYWAKQGYVRICCALNTCMCCVYSHTSVDLNEYITVVSTSKKFLTAVCNKYNFKCKW